MTTTNHPMLHESLILIGAALIFTVENWDEFIAMTEMDNKTDEEKKVAEDIKAMMLHLARDMYTDIERNEMLTEAMRKIAPFLFQ